MARTLADGHGYASPFGSAGLPPETGFPPLYPTLLAAADVVGMSVLRWAAWINAAAFAALIVLVAAMVYDLSRSALATVLGAALTLTFVPLLDLYVHVWSEPAYLVWQVLALWMLARYNARGARTDLAIAGVAASLGALTRYAGLALLPAGLIVLLAARRRPLRARLVDCAAYAAITAIPLGLWLLRNVLEASSATGRTVSYRQIHSDRIHRAWVTVSGWIDMLRLGSPTGLWWLAGLLAVALAAGLLWYRSFDGLRNDAGWGLVAALVFVVVYAVFLWVSVAVAARGVHFTGRILSPLMVGLILAAVMAGQVSWSASPARYAVPALLGLAAVVGVVHAGRLERDAVSVAGSHRAFLRAVAQLAPDLAGGGAAGRDGRLLEPSRTALGGDRPTRARAARPAPARRRGRQPGLQRAAAGHARRPRAQPRRRRRPHRQTQQVPHRPRQLAAAGPAGPAPGAGRPSGRRWRRDTRPQIGIRSPPSIVPVRRVHAAGWCHTTAVRPESAGVTISPGIAPSLFATRCDRALPGVIRETSRSMERDS